MGMFFKKNDFQVGYKQRPFDSYKAAVDKLDEETKRKFDRQRQKGMLIVVAFVFILIVILAVTGIGIDKNKSVSGHVFVDKEKVLIECLGDSLTEGFTVYNDGSTGIARVTYPMELETQLTSLFKNDGNTYKCQEINVKNFGQSGSLLADNSFSRLSGSADIVVLQYIANNFLEGEEYEGFLENNIGNIIQQGSKLFILNYPYAEGAEGEEKLEQANNYIASVADGMSTSLIDVHSYFDTLEGYETDDLFCQDLLHLTETGYKLMGDYAAQEIHQYYFDMY